MNEQDAFPVHQAVKRRHDVATEWAVSRSSQHRVSERDLQLQEEHRAQEAQSNASLLSMPDSSSNWSNVPRPTSRWVWTWLKERVRVGVSHISDELQPLFAEGEVSAQGGNLRQTVNTSSFD